MAGERVLVVEDDLETRKILVVVLEQAGYTVASADDGEVALLQIEARRPDLIVLDMVMPGMSGWAFLRRLAERAVDVPVIVVSGQYASPAPLGALGGSVAAYLAKPFNMAQLVNTCARVLDPAAARPDRRAERREALILGATLLSPDGRAIAVGHATNLGATGLAIDMAGRLAPGQRIELAVGLPGQLEPLRVTADVMWRSGDGAGLSFVDLSAAARQRIETFLSPASGAKSEPAD
jgi:DNA-binding response OmpR family regulator